MSASSSAASSSLARPRGAVLIVAALLCAYGTYYLWNSVNEELEASQLPNTTLHRSNAVRTRRRRTNTGDLNDRQTNTDGDLPTDAAEDENENVDHNPLARTLTDGETVADDTVFAEDYGWANPDPYERNGQNIVQLLFRVSEDATRRNAYVHRGCECNSCGAVPIRGIRYHCANCADYDLCEGCESQGFHTKTHIFYKIRVPAPSFGPILSMPVAYSGDPDSIAKGALSKELTIKLSRETGFERPELDAYWEQWTFMANTEWKDDPDEIHVAMDRKTFEQCLVPSGGYRQAAPSLIFDRMFAFYDTNHDDLISFPEFLHGIAYRKKKDKWAKIFQGYDIDGDGYVDRKDFLRMFRSYYTLYRQMHHDMLGGMQEQQMIMSNAHRIVNGRQPLSSAFNMQTYPGGADIRAGEGKMMQQNGELEIHDGKGTVNESGNDTGNREEIFRQSNAPSGFWNRERGARAYWETMLSPPQNADQLSERAQNLNRVRGAVREILNGDEPNRPAWWPTRGAGQDGADDETSSDDYDSSNDSVLDPENDHTWMPDDITLTDADAVAVEGPGTRLVDLQRSSRRAVIIHAMARERSDKALLEHWKKRQFYTDEEEGGTAPSNWKDEDDILVQNSSAGESSKSQTRPPFHSRSSSKVRFAEDMDGLDIRSNPSTSSRSVPERWGGIEIPDAEKDSGKEILFQVTQQAFNELLDPLFKAKEDAAVKAAERKDDLEKYRSQFSTPDFVKWAGAQKLLWSDEVEKTATAEPISTKPAWTDVPRLVDVEIPELRQRPLAELLEASGYSIYPETSADAILADPALAENEHVPRDEHVNNQDSQIQGRDEELVSVPAVLEAEARSLPSENGDSPTSLLDVPDPTPIVTPNEEIYEDPTMPQFMPDSRAASKLVEEVSTPTLTQLVGPTPISLEKDTSAPTSPEPTTETPKRKKGPSQGFLLRLWMIDQDIKESEKRGGWGRLNFEEFETSVKQFVKEGKGNQMDYLGSWIEFCIP